jgi:6-pyruvoyltetrahydropterin/6-carboxytetrahydropterin synthase
LRIEEEREMLVTREFDFSSAHRLVEYEGRCENLHGHTYRLSVTVEAPMGKDGMAFDFIRLKEIVRKEVVDVLDHRFLNDIIPQSTAENIAIWSWKALADLLPLHEIRLYESPDSYVTYRGEEEGS